MHFVADWAPAAWEEAGCPVPPPLVRITYGPASDVGPHKKDADKGAVGAQTSAGHSWPGELANVAALKAGELRKECACCTHPLDLTKPGSFFVCPATGCERPATHIPCLARAFLNAPFGEEKDPMRMVPGAGRCPSCGTVARWIDLIGGMRRRVGFVPATRTKKVTKAGEIEVEEAEEDMGSGSGSSADEEEEEEGPLSARSDGNVVAMHALLPPLALPSKPTKDLADSLAALDLGKAKGKENRRPVAKAATDPGPAKSKIGASRKRIVDERMKAYSLPVVAASVPIPGTLPDDSDSSPPPKSSSPSSEETDSFHSASSSPPPETKEDPGSDDEDVLGRLRGLLDRIRVD